MPESDFNCYTGSKPMIFKLGPSDQEGSAKIYSGSPQEPVENIH